MENMNGADMVRKAMSVAVAAHEGQVDKAGAPYIYHPVRVALCCSGWKEKAVALLHDVIEDGGAGEADLLDAGFPEDVVTAVSCLTKKDGEDYMDYVRRVGKNSLARSVKIMDLADNMDVSRLGGRPHWKLDLYREALEYLESL